VTPTAQKSSKKQWKGIDTSGVFGATMYRNVDATRHNSSGGYIKNGTAESAAIYYDDIIRTESFYLDGGMYFNASNSITTSLTELDVNPEIFAAEKWDQNRMNFVPNYWSESAFPPRQRYIRSTGYFQSGTTVVGTYQELKTISTWPVLVQTWVDVHGNIPMTTAWDAYSGRTVFARVDTDPDSGGGGIWLYPGLVDSTYKLQGGEQMPSSTAADPYYSFNYRNRTDQRVGVACAPNRNTFAYNCILAWNDRGIPDANLLYRYFRLNGGDVEWSSDAPAKRSGADTNSAVSAAFINGYFYLAWKDRNGNVEYTKNSGTNYFSWTTTQTVGTNFSVVEPPAWYYVPHQTHEAALVWTVK
jgi:hypothetical protein